ncbi:hypothetical protein CKF54_05080 [Psittacicella hinzii]|uniref:BPL/LPL catalytic domain-containing protein n=1 Tax=Psittacicella hinzii TaxID=2028575 RepID=A0A3A1Y8B0_9GAMM|nr:hypothetical protein [Psittacicella hinzii]RIY32354.1 hypothetical protein CKF54_05080 [Psittacicella hinzii]
MQLSTSLTLPTFTLLDPEDFPYQELGWQEAEEQLLDWCINDKRAYCLIHSGEKGVVVPHGYQQRFANFQQVQADLLAQDNFKVFTRTSGGGVVPATPEVINLHLVYLVETEHPLNVAHAQYELLCKLIADFLAGYGIEANAQAVEGSFCDGKYNLAVQGKKIVGTAQKWQKAGENLYAVLSHALLLVGDSAYLTALTNQFEEALGTETRYLVEKTTTVNEWVDRSAEEIYEDFVEFVETQYCEV